ncbi:MAG: hypothetical protein CVV44_22785 [Spirochaetae bacterium HGW-Spirochaetae-1]|jgi:hypothetical protein|nr:MAG: hypothetical protein CVV44_22785 [Spirochaetae bacterium HGW-Spirochaetae-1]
MKKKKQIDASYYDKTDLSDMMLQADKKKKVYKAETKRITINITHEVYEDAHDLDRFMGMGYQNVLKTAMMMGLKDLHDIVSREKKKKKEQA